MSERNPDRDWPVMRAREDVREAQRALKDKPTPFNALDLQAKQNELAQLTRLELVKKDNDEERS